MGAFDDLIPQKKQGGTFDDLIPDAEFLNRQQADFDSQKALLDDELRGGVGTQALVGLGRGFQTVGEGVAGLALDAGNAIGLVDDQTINDFDKKTKEGREFFENSPVGNTFTGDAAEFVGEILPAIPAGGGIIKGGTKLASRLGAGRFAQAAGLGALGAAEGALVSSTDNQAGGALLGGVLAPIGDKAVRGLGAGLNKLRSSFSKKQTGAINQIAKDLKADGLSTDDVVARLDDLGPEAVIADVGGENTSRLADVAFQRGGKAADSARKFVEKRQLGSLSRVEKSIKSKVGDFDDFIAKQESIISEMKSRAAPLYEEAYKVDIPIDQRLQDVLMVGGELKPAVKKAWKEAGILAADEGVELGRVGDDLISTREVDFIKRGLDTIIEKNTSEFGKVNTRGRSVLSIKNQLLEIVDSQNPAFKQARQAYEGGAKLKAALNDGLAFFREDADSLISKLSSMTESERLMFQQGAAKGLRNKLAKAQDGANQFKRALGNKFSRDQIQAVIGPDNFDEFSKILGAENTFSNTRASFAGSQTQPRQRKNAEVFADGVGAIADLSTGNRSAFAEKILRFAANRSVANDAKADEIVQSMFAQGLDQQQVLRSLRALEASAEEASKPALRGAIGLVSSNAGSNLIK